MFDEMGDEFARSPYKQEQKQSKMQRGHSQGPQHPDYQPPFNNMWGYGAKQIT